MRPRVVMANRPPQSLRASSPRCAGGAEQKRPLHPFGELPPQAAEAKRKPPSVASRQLPPLRRGSGIKPFPRRRGKRSKSPPQSLRDSFPRCAGGAESIPSPAGRDRARPSGRARVAGGRKGACGAQDLGQHIGGPQQHVVVPESEDAERVLANPAVALDVVARVEVLAAIQFHHQTTFDAGEVDDVSADRVLAPETQAVELAAAQVAPEMALGVRRVSSQTAGEIEFGMFTHGGGAGCGGSDIVRIARCGRHRQSARERVGK